MSRFSRSNLCDLEVIFQVQTERGICVRSDESSKEDIWLPLAQVEVDAPKGLIRGSVITLTGPVALFEEKGLV